MARELDDVSWLTIAPGPSSGLSIRKTGLRQKPRERRRQEKRGEFLPPTANALSSFQVSSDWDPV